MGVSAPRILKYLETFQQGERGSLPLALGPRGLDSDQLGLGHRGDLLVADSGEGVEGAGGQAVACGQGERRGRQRAGTLLGDEERLDGQAPLRPAPHLPHGFVEDVPHPGEVLARRHLVEEAPEPARQRHPFGCRHLPGQSGGDGAASLGSDGPSVPRLLPGEHRAAPARPRSWDEQGTRVQKVFPFPEIPG